MAILKKEKYFFDSQEVLIIFVQLDTCRNRLRTGLAEMTHDVFVRSSPVVVMLFLMCVGIAALKKGLFNSLIFNSFFATTLYE